MAEDSRPHSPRLDLLKRRVYGVALSIAGFAALVGYLVDVELRHLAFVRFVYGPLVTTICFGVALTIRFWPRAVDVIERTAYLGAGAFLVLRTFLLFFFAPENVPVTQLVGDIAPWTAAVFALAFVALETRQALPATIALYGVLLSVGIAFVIHRGPTNLAAAELNAIVQELLFANAFTAALMWFMARTKEELAEERTERMLLAKIAHTDELTGIANRRHILQACQKAMDRAQRDGSPFSVLMFDVDHFKRVNDSFGHATGDAVLTRVASVVQQSLRSGDDFGRFGGEEFLVLAYGADPGTAGLLAERLREAITSDASPCVPHVTASFGIASLRPG